MAERSLPGGRIARYADWMSRGGGFGKLYRKERARYQEDPEGYWEWPKVSDQRQPVSAAQTEKVIGDVMNLVTPMAKIGGLAGILAGPGAKTANKRALALAKALKERGHPDEEIWQQTGKQFDQPWWLGHPDEVPRFEIDDSMAAFGVPGPGTYAQREAMWHPELQKAYPDLAKSKLEVIPDFPYSGQYSSAKDRIRMGADQAADPVWGRNVNLHELQHAIQSREGMTAGGAPAQFYDPEKAEAAHQLYRRLGGEMDARAVQHRKDLTQGERLAKPFWESYDVPMKEMVLAEQLRKPK